VPFRGRAIARLHGERFEEFWSRNYAEPVGRAKAKLLVRYGLEYDTPNPQNLLVELDRRFAPTGVVALRDLGDTEPIVEDAPGGAVGWTRLLRDLRPETRNSFWAFDEAAEDSVSAEVLADWRERHDRAYLAEIARLLGLREGPTTFAGASDFLRSPQAEPALARLFDRSPRASRRRLFRREEAVGARPTGSLPRAARRRGAGRPRDRARRRAGSRAAGPRPRRGAED
jgi:hypothetical protein